MSPTQWIPGILVLITALCGALLYLAISRQKRETLKAGADDPADLDTRAQRLIDQLKELTADQHHLGEAQFSAEKDRLEREAASALVQRSALARSPRKEPAITSTADASWLARHPQMQGAFWGGGLVLFFAILGLFLMQEQKPRASGQEVTGKMPGAGKPAEAEADDPHLKLALEQVRARPNDPAALANAAHELLSRQAWDEARQLTDRASGIDPFDLESRIHRAFLKATQGKSEEALRDLAHLYERYPNSQEALLLDGAVATQAGNLRRAVDSFERYLIEAPPSEQPPTDRRDPHRRDGLLQPAPALTLSDATTGDRQGLLAMAVDPGYEKNHFVYIVYTATSGFRLARFRGVGDTLGDRAILMDGVASRSARPAASLRFGPDGKLYAGFDDAGDALRAGDLGSFNGKILRLNADATTPADQAGGTPVYAANVNAPRGVDWDASGATLWVVEDAARGSGNLQAVVAEDTRERRGTAVRRYSLPDGTGVAGLAFYRGELIPEFRGDLLLAADAEHAVMRLRFDAADPRKVVATERLLGDSLDGARTIGVGRDGAIYLCAAHTLIRLAPAAAPGRIPSRSAPGTP